MALIEVCENHPRRTRVIRFVYVDGHGITYDRAYCPECGEDVLEDEPRWRPFADGYIWVQEPCDGKCGAGDAYHERLRAA